jgi:hypothetical protein
MFSSIVGVDFSGARLAGRNTWLASIEPAPRRRGRPAFKLTSLAPLEKLCGTAERAAALAFLVKLIADSERALWALDFPFGLPVEVVGARWARQFDFLGEWGEDDYGVGLECVRRAKLLGGPKHIRRLTDIEEKAPFDPYHYRIIYQTFYGMRDVLGPLARCRTTAVLPFQYAWLANANRAVLECCPSCVLKCLRLPHQNYKQPTGGPLTRVRKRTRHALLAGLAPHVEIAPTLRRTIMRNPGGDALDAVIAAVGTARAWHLSDHESIRGHPRYGREGHLYAV